MLVGSLREPIKKIAGESVSRILSPRVRCWANSTPLRGFGPRRICSAQLQARGVAIIPLGPGSLRGSSSLPEGCSRSALASGSSNAPKSVLRASIRAGPALPSYLTLLHAGFSVPSALLPERWALTPPFHPYQMRSTGRGWPLVLPRACRRGLRFTGGLFSVAPSVAARQIALSHDLMRNPLALPGALPCTLRLRMKPRIPESGLSSRRPLSARGRLRTGRRSPDSPAWLLYRSSRVWQASIHPLLNKEQKTKSGRK